MLGRFCYHEIDSNTLPVLSLQYKGSVVIQQEDIDRAKKDFPSLYQGVNTYDDLRSAKLIKINDDKWISYYVPIYPLTCIPFKLFLTVLGLPQERAFSITNAFLIIIALSTVCLLKNISDKQKFFSLLLLMINPIIYYVNYINYEVFMFSMIIISLVMYHNEYKKRSALFLSLAAVSNPTAAAVGLVMILQYIIDVFRNNRGKTFSNLIKNNWKETIQYALCFVPCFSQFIYYEACGCGVGGGSNSEMTLKNYFPRFLSYLFDPTLGLPTFAVMQVLFLFIFLFICIKKKDLKNIFWGLSLFAVIAAFSLMHNINCGMTYCARYLVWSYPILAIFIALNIDQLLSNRFVRNSSKILIVSSTVALIMINSGTKYSFGEFNYSTKFILNNFPSLYNPYSATFYCRTLHDGWGGYSFSKPAYYLDSNGSSEIRKIIYKSNEESVQTILSELCGDEDSMKYLTQKLSVKYDDNFHYINLPRNGKKQLTIKPRNLELGKEIFFDNSENDAHNYFVQGMSNTENTFAWTDNNKVRFKCFVFEMPDRDLNLRINVSDVFFHPQRIVIASDTRILARETVETAQIINVNIPAQCIESNIIDLTFELPDAISPDSLGISFDNRNLGL